MKFIILSLLLLISCGKDKPNRPKIARQVPVYRTPWPNPTSMEFRGTKTVYGSVTKFLLYNKVEKCTITINKWSSSHYCIKRSY